MKSNGVTRVKLLHADVLGESQFRKSWRMFFKAKYNNFSSSFHHLLSAKHLRTEC